MVVKKRFFPNLTLASILNDRGKNEHLREIKLGSKDAKLAWDHKETTF
jgi:hypothetical protein